MNPNERSREAYFELRHLRYFTALVRERNFERAASALGIAQPGLSQQIMNLEKIVGQSLLDRSKRSVHLTAAGQLLFDRAQEILASTEATLSELQRVGRGEAGSVSVGYVASAAYSGTLTSSLAAFRLQFPEVELHLFEMEMGRQLQGLVEGSLDFGYIRPPAPLPSQLLSTAVFREPLVAALPAEHPLALNAAVLLTDMVEETFITPSQPSEFGFHANTIAACADAGFTPKIDASGRDFTTIASMVAVGLGVALVPKSMECLQLPGVRYLPLLGTGIKSEVAAVFRKTEASPAVRAFVAQQRQAS